MNRKIALSLAVGYFFNGLITNRKNKEEFFPGDIS
jgi:hypothetical protein